MNKYYPYKDFINNFFYRDTDGIHPKTFLFKFTKRQKRKIEKIIKKRWKNGSK